MPRAPKGPGSPSRPGTTLCSFINTSAGCKFGSKCKNFHPTMACPAFAAGSCPNGRSCMMLHNASAGSPAGPSQPRFGQRPPSPAPAAQRPATAAPPLRHTLRFDADTSPEHISEWGRNSNYTKYPCPRDAFRSRRMAVFWDIENCVPFGVDGPEECDELLWSGLKQAAGVTRAKFSIVASMSINWRYGGSALSFERMTTLNSKRSWFTVLGAPGKTNTAVHAVHREADNQINAKINEYLETATADDVLVVISGDTYYEAACAQAKSKGLNLIIIGPRGCTSEAMRQLSDHWMEWETFWQFRVDAARCNTRDMEINRRSAIDANKKQVVAGNEMFRGVKELDVVIVLDVTGSMDQYLAAVRDKIQEVFENLAVRFKWAGSHMRFALVAYRDFDIEPLPTIVSPLGAPAEAASSAARLAALLQTVKADGGGDGAEDVIGGLLKAAEVIRAGRTGATAARKSIVFHVCDAPSHGVDFNGGAGDSYPNGPIPVESDEAKNKLNTPAGRVKPWRQEAQEVLLDLKRNLGVQKYVVAQVMPKWTTPMIKKFKELVGDPPAESDEWTWSQMQSTYKAGEAARKAGKQQTEEELEPWIEALEFNSGTDAAAICNAFVRMIVSTTLAAVSRLSKLTYDTSKGVSVNKFRHQGESHVLVSLEESAEEMDADGPGGSVASEHHVQGLAGEINSAAAPGTAGGRTSRRPQAGAGRPADTIRMDTHDETKAQLKKAKEKLMNRFVRRSKAVAISGEDLQFKPPSSLENLVDGIRDAIRSMTRGIEPDPLLTEKRRVGSVAYVKPSAFAYKGAQRLVYEALREESQGRNVVDRELVVMKEYLTTGVGVHSKFRYKRHTQGSVVAGFLAHEFNAACAAAEHNLAMPLEYLETWTAACRVDGRMLNYHVEPLVLGKYVKYNSNFGYCAVNMSATNDACQAFTHWTWAVTEGLLMVADVQGVRDHTTKRILLTDPAVHCVAYLRKDRDQDVHGRFEGYFDESTDQGATGVKNFFMTHQCNGVCRKLGLRPALEELQSLRARTLAGKLPGLEGLSFDLDEEMP